MADRLLNENSGVDGFLLEDGSGVLLIEDSVTTNVPNALMMMGVGAYLLFISTALLEYLTKWRGG